MLLNHRIYFYNIVILSFFLKLRFRPRTNIFRQLGRYTHFRNVIKNWLPNNISINKITKINCMLS
jgi:hypothetical protein